MFNDILIKPNNNELHVYSYFDREFICSVKLNDKIQI